MGIASSTSNAARIKGKTVNDTDIGNGKALVYNTTTGNLEYVAVAQSTDLTALNAHLANVSNPHATTAAQVGAYTQAQVNTLLTGYSATGHTHLSSQITDATSAATANMIAKRGASSEANFGTVVNTKNITTTGLSNVKSCRSVAGFYGSTNTTGYLVIQTPYAFLNITHNLTVRGWRTTTESQFTAEVSFYAYGVGPSIMYPVVTWHGAKALSVQMGRNTATGNVVIIIGAVDTAWPWSQVTVDAMLGFAGISDSYFEGWTTAVTTDISGYSLLTSAVQHNPSVNSSGYLGVGMGTSTIPARLSLPEHTTAVGGLAFGADVNLYKSAADTLRTDDVMIGLRFTVAGAAVGNTAFASYIGVEAQNRFLVTCGGVINWSDGTLSADTNLYRQAADQLRTDDHFIAATLGVATTTTPSGLVAIGGNPSNLTGQQVGMAYSPTTTSGTHAVLAVQNIGTPAANHSGAVIGVDAQAGTQSTNAFTFALLDSVRGTIFHRGTNAVAATNSFFAASPTISGGGTIMTACGVKIALQDTGASVGTGYGIYQEGAGDLNYFAGKVGLNTSSSMSGVLNLASGTTAAAGIYFGTDVTLYRSNTSELTTNNKLVVTNSLVSPRHHITNNANTVQTTYGVAAYRFNGAPTGAIVIQMPFGFTNHMTILKVRGYRFDTNAHFEADVAFYNFSGSLFMYPYMHFNGSAPFTVRLAKLTATGNICLILGDVGTVWQYPNISVDVQFGHSVVTATHYEGWTTSLVTDLAPYDTVTAVTQTNPYTNLSGYVGIGNTAAAQTPSYPLHVESSTNIALLRLRNSGAANNTSISIDSVASRQASILYSTNGVSKFQLGKNTDESFFLWDSTLAANALYVAPTGYMTLGSSTYSVQNVGIGGTSTSAKFNVTQTDTSSSGTPIGLRIANSYTQTSTAASCDLYINRTQVSVGSGTQRFIDLAVAGSSKFSIDNLGNTSALSLITNGIAGNVAFGNLVSGESVHRFVVFGSGTMEFGDGTLARDVNLYRNAANVLKTDDAFHFAGGQTTSAFSVVNAELSMDGNAAEKFLFKNGANNKAALVTDPALAQGYRIRLLAYGLAGTAYEAMYAEGNDDSSQAFVGIGGAVDTNYTLNVNGNAGVGAKRYMAKMAVGQTTNPIEVRNSSDTVLTKVDSAGVITATKFVGAVNRPNTRRTTMLSYSETVDTYAGTTIYGLHGYGDIITNVSTTALTVPDANEGPMVMFTSSAVGGSQAGLYGSALYRTGRNTLFQTRVKLSSIVAERIWIGVTSNTASAMVTNDAPTGNFAGFWFSTVVGHTNWQVHTRDNVTTNTTDSTIAVATTTSFEFEVEEDTTAGVWRFKIDGVTVATTSTNIPAANTNLRFVIHVSTSAAAAKSLSLGWVYLETDK